MGLTNAVRTRERSPREKVYLDYHAWSADAQAAVEAGVHITDEEYDRMVEHLDAIERQDRTYSDLSGPMGRSYEERD